MTEVLPTPHSIAVATLISLYSDPQSPIYPNNNDGNTIDTGWPARLSSLIQRLLREDDGHLDLSDNIAVSENETSSTAIHHVDLNEDEVLADLMNLMNGSGSVHVSGANDKATAAANCGINNVNQTQQINLYTESLSTLLTRIDHAYINNSPLTHEVKRTPPSTALLTTLQTATQSIEHLTNLIDTFHSLLDNQNSIHLDGESSFGIHLRRICLGMEEMGFEVLRRLWIAFGVFVDEATDAHHVNETNVDETSSSQWLPSSGQVESIIKKTCLNSPHLQSTTTTTPSINLHKALNTSNKSNLLTTHPETPSLHFLLYLTSLQNNQRCSTLESLHRYFDYGMIHERKERVERSLHSTTSTATAASANMNTGGITTTTSTTPRTTLNSYKESNIMQYAAILLAQTHYRMGYISLALQATQEAIRVAQQVNDTECVLFAQAWLAHIEGDTRALRRCRDRAVEVGLTCLSGVTLELGRREGYCRVFREDDDLEEGEDGCLAWGSIWNAGRAVSNSGGIMRGGGGASAVQGGGGQFYTDLDNLSSADALRILGRQNMAISGLWDSTGHTSMGCLASCAALHGFGSYLGAEEASAVMRRILASFSYGSGLDTWAKEGMGQRHDQCVYSASLNSLSCLYGRGSTLEWVQSTTSILHEWSVRSYDLEIARSLQYILANHAAFPSGPLNAVESTLISLTQSTHYLIQAGDFASAKAATRQAFSLAKNHSLLIHQGWQLLQLALIDLEASTSAPSSNASVERSLPPLLECLHLAEKRSMDPLRAVAMTTLAKIFLCMGRYQRARAMLKASIPLVMQHGHIWFQAEACLTMAKCNLAEARSIETETTLTNALSSPIALKRSALSQLENAASLFQKIEDIKRLQQTYYLQSMVYNTIPRMQSKRDEAAEKFTQMLNRRKVGSKLWNVVHGVLVGDASSLCRVSLQ